MKAAAASGDIVAIIIQKAASRSVLTPALAQMDTRVANLQTSLRSVTTKVAKVYEKGKEPRADDNDNDKVKPLNGGIIAIGFIVAAAFAIAIGIVFPCGGKDDNDNQAPFDAGHIPSPPLSQSLQSPSTPVGFCGTQHALVSAHIGHTDADTGTGHSHTDHAVAAYRPDGQRSSPISAVGHKSRYGE